MEASSSSATPATGDQSATEIQTLTEERDRLLAEKGQTAETTAQPAASDVSPLDALKASMEANPEGSFMEHLHTLADDGIKAVINPAFEHDALRVLAALVSDVVKVKL